MAQRMRTTEIFQPRIPRAVDRQGRLKVLKQIGIRNRNTGGLAHKDDPLLFSAGQPSPMI